MKLRTNDINVFQDEPQKLPNIIRAKCILVGDSTVGKTSFVEVFNSDSNSFPQNYLMTCGLDIVMKSINVPDTNDIVELFLYDSSGKELYLDMMTKLWHHPCMVVVVFDVTDENSFNNCSKWLERVRSCSNGPTVKGVLVGNKTDLIERRVVNQSMAQEFAKKQGLQYFECSAKDMTGVDEVFFYLVNEWHKLYVEKTDHFKVLV